MVSNRREDHEISTLALQIHRLIWEHVNHYGHFELDMDARPPTD